MHIQKSIGRELSDISQNVPKTDMLKSNLYIYWHPECVCELKTEKKIKKKEM